MNELNVVLASGSLRRKELLKYVFEDFRIIVPKIDEKSILKKIISNSEFNNNIEKFSHICYMISYNKCKEISENEINSLVISADTVVYDENKIFGKPVDENDAIYMLKYLSGKKHIVQTSVTIHFLNKFYTFNEKTIVEFNKLDYIQEKCIKDYVKSGSPYDKSGGYGIQDRGSLLVKSINGDFFNVVGLPVSKLNRELIKIIKSEFKN